MTDERGGRYFREARFFLAGDKVAAQSHILEARSLMGYMRDMQALGGPPIQVKYATLKDGTQIKATMMNGQYQAEIISPFGGVAKKSRRIPTIAGHKDNLSIAPWGTVTVIDRRAFRWQEATGVVVMELPAPYTHAYPTQVSLDGQLVGGTLWRAGYPSHHAVWDADGHVTDLGVSVFEINLDVTFGEPKLVPIPTSLPVFGTWRNTGITEDVVAFHGSWYDGTTVFAASVRKDADGNETIGVQETAGTYSDVHSVHLGGERCIGTYNDGSSVSGSGDAAMWERDPDTGLFVRTMLHPDLNGYAYGSLDGDTVVANVHRERSPFPDDDIPAVLDVASGELQMIEPFFDPIVSTVWQSAKAVGVFSEGGVTVIPGSEQFNVSYAVAWEKAEVGFVRIPGIDFTGACTAIN